MKDVINQINILYSLLKTKMDEVTIEGKQIENKILLLEEERAIIKNLRKAHLEDIKEMKGVKDILVYKREAKILMKEALRKSETLEKEKEKFELYRKGELSKMSKIREDAESEKKLTKQEQVSLKKQKDVMKKKEKQVDEMVGKMKKVVK